MIYLNKYLTTHDRTIHTQFISLTNISKDGSSYENKVSGNEKVQSVNDAG